MSRPITKVSKAKVVSSTKATDKQVDKTLEILLVATKKTKKTVTKKLLLSAELVAARHAELLRVRHNLC